MMIELYKSLTLNPWRNFVILILAISIVSCKSRRNIDSDMDICLGKELNQLLLDIEFLFDKHVLDNYPIQDENKSYAYISYLKSWNNGAEEELFLDTIVDHKLEEKIISNSMIKEILNIFTSEVDINGKVSIIEMQFNHTGKLAGCFLNSNDTIAIQYVRIIESIGNLSPTVLSNSIVKLIEDDGLFEHPNLRRIMAIEFYLKPHLYHVLSK